MSKDKVEELQKKPESHADGGAKSAIADAQKSHMEIAEIKASKGNERGEKIKALIGDSAASSGLAHQLFPEINQGMRGAGKALQGSVDMTNPDAPHYKLPDNIKQLQDGLQDDLSNDKISAKDVITMLKLAKDLGVDNKQFLPAAIAAISMPCGKAMVEGQIQDASIDMTGKTDVQEMKSVLDLFQTLKKHTDTPDQTVKTVLGDYYPPKPGTTPERNLRAVISIAQDYAIPALQTEFAKSQIRH